MTSNPNQRPGSSQPGRREKGGEERVCWADGARPNNNTKSQKTTPLRYARARLEKRDIPPRQSGAPLRLTTLRSARLLCGPPGQGLTGTQKHAGHFAPLRSCRSSGAARLRKARGLRSANRPQAGKTHARRRAADAGQTRALLRRPPLPRSATKQARQPHGDPQKGP